MWEVAAMVAVGALGGVLEGDDIIKQSKRDAQDMRDEGQRTRQNAFGEARDIEIGEDLAAGTDATLETSNNVTTGMSEFSAANQLLAANRQAALQESKRIMAEGERMNRLYQDRAKTTERIGKARAQRALVNGIAQGAATGYSLGKSKGKGKE